MKIVGVIILLIIAFAAGYFIRSQDCISKTTTTLTPTLTETPFQTQSLTQTPTAAPTVQPETELVFSNYNSAGVSNNPSSPTVFTLTVSRKIYLIQDYHWNNAKGKTPGTISLKSQDGKTYGPWTAQGAPGQGGVPDAYWTVYPNTEIPAGTYTIVDSDPASWAQNTGSKGIGMSQVYVVK